MNACLSPGQRVQRLLSRFPPSGQEKTWHPNGADERAVLLFDYFQRHPDEPIALRYANGFAHVLSNIAIQIGEDELLVGEVGLEDVAELRPIKLKQANHFWQKRNERFNRSFAWYNGEQRAARHGLCWKWASRDGHVIPAFAWILSQGLGRLRQDARQAVAENEDRETQVFREAMAVALDALAAYILRYSELARTLAGGEANLERRAELYQIAQSCLWLSEHAPRSFYEALQLVWFVHLGCKLDDGSVGHSFGRFDQYLYPYYQSDCAAGVQDETSARELLALFWIRLNREDDDIANLTLGGVSEAGEDATNPLTLLCLQVERWVSRKQPNLSVRVHPKTPPDLWNEIAASLLRGAGHPAIFNDDIMIPGLLAYGISAIEARNYAPVGCVETYLPGLSAPWTDAYLNLAKCVELALHDGRDFLSGEQIGPHTGDARKFASFGDLFAAFERQVREILTETLAAKDDYDACLSSHAPEPLNSALIQDCLKRGKDATSGGARRILMGVYGVGLGTAVDALAALKELVFERGLITIEDLLVALQANFQGYESIRMLCRQRAPKYGNDDPRADDIAARIIEGFGEWVKEYSDTAWLARSGHTQFDDRQAYHYAMFGSVLSHTEMGALTQASAGGRLAGETLSDGASPSQGCNRRGATATLCSLARGDHRKAPGGAAVNLHLSPAYFNSAEGSDLLINLLKTYFTMGGEQLQVNMVTPEILRLAMRSPELYRDLVVRVAGFTATFVSLSPALQQELVKRVETSNPNG